MQHNYTLVYNTIQDTGLLNYCTSVSTQWRVNFKQLSDEDYGQFFKELAIIIHSTNPRQLLWHVINNIVDIPKCKCGAEVSWVPNSIMYRKTCSSRCARANNARVCKPKSIPWYKDPIRAAEVAKKKKDNCLSKYGVEHSSQRQEIKNKIANTNMSRYGGVAPIASHDVKNKIKSTLIAKYGVDNISKLPETTVKKIETSNRVYGVPHPSQSQVVKDKQHSTMKKRWGTPHALKNSALKEKQHSTNLLRYGSISPFGNSDIRKKSNSTINNKYGVTNFSRLHVTPTTASILDDKLLFEEAVTGHTLTEICNNLHVSLRTILNYATLYDVRDKIATVKVSSYENIISNLLDEYNVAYVKNNRTVIAPYELDFYIPHYNLAIEVGGAYFHCEVSANKNRLYHYNKWKMCRDKNITLLQYFDNDIINNTNIIRSKILRLLGKSLPVVGARKLQLTVINDYASESEFLIRNHLQGPTSKRTLVIAAYYNDVMVGVSTWLIKNDIAELIRFATNIDCSYPGLFSRMLKMFISVSKFKGKLISFSDNRHSNGKLYLTNGFILEHVSAPGYSYTNDFNKFESRLKYQKHKLQKIFKIDEFDQSLSEWDIMQQYGYDRLWDAGQSKWIRYIT
jgi:hypothetical protein